MERCPNCGYSQGRSWSKWILVGAFVVLYVAWPSGNHDWIKGLAFCLYFMGMAVAWREDKAVFRVLDWPMLLYVIALPMIFIQWIPGAYMRNIPLAVGGTALLMASAAWQEYRDKHPTVPVKG